MCEQKAPAKTARRTTESGVVYYDDTPEGHAAQAEDEAKAAGGATGEGAHPEPGDPPAPQDVPSTECKDYKDSMWDTACSKYFKYSQMKMKPETPTIACNWQHLCQEILDKIIDGGGPKFSINSAYRSSAYNAKIGGASKSDHLTGSAADITAGSVEANKALFKWIGQNLNTKFSQIIFEGNWVHVAYNGASAASVAVLVTRTGKPAYQNGGGRSGNALPPDLKWA